MPLWSLHHLNLFWMLLEETNFPDGGSSIISGIIELAANSFGRNWTIQMLIQFSSGLPTISFNASRSPSVSWEVRPESLRLLESFLRYLNSVMNLDIVALKPSSSSVLVTEAPAIRAPTIYPSSNSLRLCILIKILVKSEKWFHIYSQVDK